MAKETILNIYKDLQEGHFEDNKLELAKKVLISNAQEMFDKQRQMVDYCICMQDINPYKL